MGLPGSRCHQRSPAGKAEGACSGLCCKAAWREIVQAHVSKLHDATGAILQGHSCRDMWERLLQRGGGLSPPCR